LAIVVVALLLVFRSLGAKPQPVKYTFEETTEEWVPVPSATAGDETLSLTDETADVKVGKHSLKIHYKTEQGKIAGIVHPVNGVIGGGVRVWLKTDSAATLVLGLVEKDGSAYMRPVQTLANDWLHAELPFSAFTLSNDSKDENGVLDLEQVGTLIVADAAGFMPGAGVERTLWMDDYEISSDFQTEKPKPYIPLLETGTPSASGARITAGTTYVKGKFGQAVLANSPGELAAVPINVDKLGTGNLQWKQGTIECWISPQVDTSKIQDFAGLIVMQAEPFITGLNGSLFVIYIRPGRLAFMMNNQMEHILATPELNWKKGELHHLAVSWGERGMRLYVDGKLISSNDFKGAPAMLCGDVVVGNHAWTLQSNRFADTAVDELRLSKIQRTDREIAASAKATVPLKLDKDTLSLEHFDGQPLPPICIKGGMPVFNSVPADNAVSLSLVIPGSLPVAAKLSYTVSQPGGAVVADGSMSPGSSAKAGPMLALKPLIAPGFYRIKFYLKSGQKLVSEGADWIRVVSSSPVTSEQSKLFGAAGCYTNPTDGESFFSHAEAAGVHSFRIPFDWAEIEPADGRFVWDKYDEIVRWANKHHVELIPTFMWENPQPSWAGRGVVKVGGNEEHYPPEDMAKWSEFIFQVVSRYKGSVKWWIPANEPNLSKYWHPRGDAKAYVELLRVSQIAIKNADPEAKTLGCSVGGLDLSFLETCFKEGALKYCDAVGMHPYICPHSPDQRFPLDILNPTSQVGTFRDGLLAAKALITKYGGTQNLWLDEVGQPYRNDFISPDWGVSEPKAAEDLVKMYLESSSSGTVDRLLWFSFWGGEFGSFSLLKPGGSPTLSMAAFSALEDRLDGARLVSEGGRGSGMRSLIYMKGNRRIEVVWVPDGEHDITLKSGETADDMYGFAMPLKPLKLTTQPVYLESNLE